MGRSILAVVVSYIGMFVLAFIAFTCAYLIVGSEAAFKPGIYEASTRWIGIAFVINIVVSIIGGIICALIAKGGRAPLALAIVVVVLGFEAAPARRHAWYLEVGFAGGVRAAAGWRLRWFPAWWRAG